jgi:putative serine/threonine protein kinase
LRKMFCITVENLTAMPYASILSYPKPDLPELRKRVVELRNIGVTALEFCGEKEIHNLRVLGKGCVGIVVAAYVNDGKVALKIRRIDADRSQMLHEAEMLKKANLASVGPKLLKVSENFLLMQLINGVLLPEWVKHAEEVPVRSVLREILEQCWRLDQIRLDHGELSHGRKHVIVSKEDKPFIVDFETASTNRKPSNLTSISQFLFISGISESVYEKIGEKNKKLMMNKLRNYKSVRSREIFESFLQTCGLSRPY